MKKQAIAFLLVFFGFLGVSGCDLPQANTLITQQQSQRVWHRIRSSFQMEHPFERPLVRHYINRYAKQIHQINRLSHNATPYLFHVVEALQKRNLPGELALLPMVESEYKPFAISQTGAAGIWQLTRTTGKRYGVKQDAWYDGRKDILPATDAALNYLEFLYESFNKDWFLALAAYNAGEGRVQKAIRYNKTRHYPTDYWSLPLPQQTKHFVPKLIALSYLVQHPEKFGLDLAPVANRAFFEPIQAPKQMNLNVAAKLAGIDLQDLRALNAGYTRQVTHSSGLHRLLIPTEKARQFKINSNPSKQKAMIQKGKSNRTAPEKKGIRAWFFAQKAAAHKNVSHVVQKGDNLSKIAEKYQVSIRSIQKANQLKGDLIMKGDRLLIPRAYP